MTDDDGDGYQPGVPLKRTVHGCVSGDRTACKISADPPRGQFVPRGRIEVAMRHNRLTTGLLGRKAGRSHRGVLHVQYERLANGEKRL